MDGEFDMEQMYWNIVKYFDNAGETGMELLKWWDRWVDVLLTLIIDTYPRQVFGTSTENPKIHKQGPCGLDRIEAQWQAKHVRLEAPLLDLQGNSQLNCQENTPISSSSLAMSGIHDENCPL